MNDLERYENWLKENDPERKTQIVRWHVETKAVDTPDWCHCGASYAGSDHCPACGCEQYESVRCTTWCGRGGGETLEFTTVGVEETVKATARWIGYGHRVKADWTYA